jgi:hypothetical protein
MAIPVVQQKKILGLSLTASKHIHCIDYFRKKFQKALNLLKVVSKMDWGADRLVLAASPLLSTSQI